MGFFSKLMHQSQPAACVLPETHAVIRQIVTVLGFDVVSLPEYASRLAPAINSAVAYLDEQIAAIPGPLDISAAHYMHHPVVHAMFPARNEIAHAIGRSLEVKQPLAFLAGAEQHEAFALLGVRRKLNEPPGAPPVFIDHTLRSLAATESGARQGLRTAAMMRLVTSYGEHLGHLRRNDKLTRQEWNIENVPDPRIAEADKGKLLVPAEELSPDKLLAGLIAWLQRPSEYLQIGAGAAAQEAELKIDALPLLVCRDRRRWLVCLVRFPTAEGVAAVHSEPRQHRYITI